MYDLDDGIKTAIQIFGAILAFIILIEKIIYFYKNSTTIERYIK